MKLELGKFYKSKCGDVWCCFEINTNREPHWQAYCVEIGSHAVEYFYLDGRYDSEGKREHTLIERVELKDDGSFGYHD